MSTPFMKNMSEPSLDRLSVSSSINHNDKTPLVQSRLFRSLSGTDELETEVPSTRRLSTYLGVFSPVCLAIFSALLFLRVGFVVGQAGILQTTLLFLVSYLILIFTVLSVCAISTNGAVEGGGCYFMISRALGPEFGGSVGVLFFFANIFSSALYVTGCVESIIDNFGPGGNLVPDVLFSGRWWAFLYGFCICTINLIVCLIGASMFGRTSAVVLIIVVISTLSCLISIFAKTGPENIQIPLTNTIVYGDNVTGVNGSFVPKFGLYTGLQGSTFLGNLYANYSMDYTTKQMMSFPTVFAVLFSGVTGIMAGANMSGELKEPSKSIPRGTLQALLFTFVIYIVTTFMVAGSCENYLLKNDYIFLQQINWWPPFVTIGIFAATLSAALTNLIGASRVLEAVAKDDLFGFLLRPIVKGSRNGNPIAAVLATYFFVVLILIIGSLNQIAMITSVFFLLSYSGTNLACLALELASAPNFRPSFKYFTWHTAFLGLAGCITMMFLISAVYAAVSIIVCLLLLIGLHIRAPVNSWGSISQALLFHQVRKYLLILDIRKSHVKFWRPQMLLMVSNPRACCQLIDFVNDLKKGGLFVLGHVKIGSFKDMDIDPVQEDYPYWLALVDHLKIKTFVEITVAQSVREGMQQLLWLSGLGAMKPNTVVLGFYDENPQEDSFSKSSLIRNLRHVNIDRVSMEHKFSMLRQSGEEKVLSENEYIMLILDALKMQKNICLARHFHLLDKASIAQNKTKCYIDVWPINFLCPYSSDVFDTSCLFLLQLSCILSMVPIWRKRAEIRVFLCVNAQTDDTLRREYKLDQLLHQLRITAQIKIVPWENIIAMLYNHDSDTEAEASTYQMYNTLPLNYIQALNELLRQNSVDTIVSFCYLPLPPEDPAHHHAYLQQLDVLTANLSPTVLIHGVSPVTSTTL